MSVSVARIVAHGLSDDSHSPRRRLGKDADVRGGSKGEELTTSKCFPLFRAVTLARRRKIRTQSKLQRKLLRSPFRFQNCTKTAKYEALEKNVVSNRKLPSLRQSLVRSFT